MVEGESHIKLILHTGEEHNLYINSNIDDPFELMYPAFQAAMVSLKEILSNADNWLCQEQKQQDRSRQLYEYSNNILAFCAERGQGKTSAMLSFAEALRLQSHSQKKLCGLEDRYFYVIPPIDPTLLEKEDSVVEIVLSRLYHDFDELLKQGYCNNRTLSAGDKGELLRCFQECLSGLKTANRRNNTDDDFEALMQLSDCFEVKRLCGKILTELFRFIGKDGRKNYLVIPLDDTDLQFQYAYKTLEEVRKYLSIPNIVILMATNLEQLRKLIMDHHLSVLEHAVHHKVISESEIQRMAVKYLDKLIPASHAIYLPTIRVQYESNKVAFLESDGNTEVELQKGILDLVRQKTGIVFVRTDSNMHPLIPTTLRGLRQFYRFLLQMDECSAPDLPISISQKKKEEEEKKKEKEKNDELRENFCNQMLTWASKREINLNLFENYFVNDWCSSKLSGTSWNLLREFQLLSPKGCFSQAEKQIKKTLSIDSQDKRKGKSSTAQNDKVGIVQLLEQLDDAEQLDTQYFLCAVQTYLSIQLHRLALKGWRDSLYQWMNGESGELFVFRFPELYECIEGCLIYISRRVASATLNKEFLEQVKNEPDKKLAGPWLERLSADLINYLPKMLTVSKSGMGWQVEAIMIQRLKFVLEICCNLALHTEVYNYTQNNRIFISSDESYKNNNSVIEFYENLVKNLRGKVTLSGDLYGFSPILSQPEFFQTETLHQLKEYLSVAQVSEAKNKVKTLYGSMTGHTDDSLIEPNFAEAIVAVTRLTEYDFCENSARRWCTILNNAYQKYIGIIGQSKEQNIDQGSEPNIDQDDEQKSKQSDKAEANLTKEAITEVETVLSDLDDLNNQSINMQGQQGGSDSESGI